SLERRELGERRIRIGLALAPIAPVAAFDVLGAQLRIAIRPIAALARRAIAAWRPPLVTLGPIRTLGSLLPPWRTIRPTGSRRPVAPLALAIAAIWTATMVASMLFVCAFARLGGGAFRCSCGGAFRTSWRRRLAAAMGLMWPARRPALAVGTPTGAPDV